MKKKIDEKFEKDELVFERITNKNLTCRDCKFAYDDNEIPGNVSKCEMFQIKPDAVLNGGSCAYKVKK